MEIVVKNVNKTINDIKILDNINLKVNKGAVFALVGPNGAGKTTLVRLILNLYNPSGGEIFVNNINIKDKKFDQVKNHIGFLLDNIGLFKDLTAWDNLEFFDRIYYPNSKQCDRYTRISNLLKTFDLFEKKDRRINFFSRGMKQRLALARSMINEPELLILDEPSRGLDLEGQILLRDFINEAKKSGCTVFVNSHDLDELQKVCTDIAFINNGVIVDSGNYIELKDKFCENSYLLKSKDIGENLKKINCDKNISWVVKNNDEVVITVANKDYDIAQWLFQNKIKVNEIIKINDNLESLYKNIILNEKR